jgi:hypothetical protein
VINTPIAMVGGMFALLTFLHFVADWVFQSHAEAMAKTTNSWVRALHCTTYTAICCFVIELTTQVTILRLIVIAVLLFFSHFFEDTYLPVYVWARYVRKPLELQGQASLEDFRLFADTTLGKILLIAIDQIVHILFLLPVAVILVVPQHFVSAIWTGSAMLLVLGGLCKFGVTRLRKL